MNKSMWKKLLLLSVVLLTVTSVNSYKILGIFPLVSPSHFNVGEALLKGLANAGHDVTMVSPFPDGKPFENFRIVQLTGAIELWQERFKDKNVLDFLNMPSFIMIPMLAIQGAATVKYTYNHPNVIKLMESGSFDLVIVEIFSSEGLLGLGQHFNAPTIGVSTFSATQWVNNLVGSPSPISYVPHPFTSYSDRMTFWQRISNTLHFAYENILIHFYNYRLQRNIYEDTFPNANVSFDELLRNVSLVFLNTHFTLAYPRPYVPNMIEVGGMHISTNIKTLPTDIESFLNSSKNGVIYFSMGSLIKSADLKPAAKEGILKAFSKSKYDFIWKFEDETITMPSNVLIKKWLPQKEILAHKNVKAFISHGGLLSTTESIYNGKPVIGIPVFGDQVLNIEQAELSGWGIKIALENITEESLIWAINEITRDPKYSEKARAVQQRFTDKPLTPIETVVYWSEYVIRHRGAPHLHSAGVDMPFIQYHNLDVFITILLLVLLICYSVFLIIRIIIRKICKKLCTNSIGNVKKDKKKKS